ncbi:OmpA family protein [Isoalcanivorax indicus]|uniref:OmpA family protein n=1 Tax=Isoalcanivorax indicus TaxID=2202653 RepID=UPI000DB8FF34|nr:OmpA family protein [Isoalcanivorax indicus]
MKAKLLSVAALPILSLPALAVASGNMPDSYGYIGGRASYNFFYENSVYLRDQDGLENDTFFGGQVGWRFSPAWSVQATYEQADSRLESKYDSGARVNSETYFASLRHHFHNTSILGFEPYAGINAGELDIRPTAGSAGDREKDFMAGVELGVQRALIQDRLALDLGTRHAYSHDNYFTYGQVYAGLNLMFGARTQRAAEPAPEPTPRAEPTPPPQPQVTRRQVEETHTANFDFDDASISDANRAELVEAARFMRQHPQTRVTLEGHTCTMGPEEYNQRLSERRAENAKRLLVDQEGIAENRVEVVGKGEHEPVADNSTREGRAQNRRVEAIITGTIEERR